MIRRLITLAAFASLCYAGKLHVSLIDRSETIIPEMGKISYAVVVPPTYADYLITNVRVRLNGIHDNPSDCEAWVKAPDGSCFQLFYRPDQPDWTLDTDVDATSAWYGMTVAGTWEIYVGDLIPDDGGLVRNVELDMTADGGWFNPNARWAVYDETISLNPATDNKTKKEK
jgi:hypothetical protein